jgi:hypothetical protein
MSAITSTSTVAHSKYSWTERTGPSRSHFFTPPNNSMEPTQPAASRYQQPLIDSGLPAGASFP